MFPLKCVQERGDGWEHILVAPPDVAMKALMEKKANELTLGRVMYIEHNWLRSGRQEKRIKLFYYKLGVLRILCS